MAVIHECGDRRVGASEYGIADEVFLPLLEWLRQSIADDLWRWFDGHRDDKVVTIRKWIFNFTIRVRHLEGLFVILFGNRV